MPDSAERSLRATTLWAIPILAILSGLVSHLAFPSASTRAGDVFGNYAFYVPALAFWGVLAFAGTTWGGIKARNILGLAAGILLGWVVAYMLSHSFVMSAEPADRGWVLLLVGGASGAIGALISAACLRTLRVAWRRIAVAALLGAASGLLLRAYHEDNSPALFIVWQLTFCSHYAVRLWQDAEKLAPDRPEVARSALTILDLTSSLRLLKLSKGIRDTVGLLLILWLAFVLFAAFGRPAMQVWGVLWKGNPVSGAIGGIPEVLLALLPAYVCLILLIAAQQFREHILLPVALCAALVGLLAIVPVVWPMLPSDGGHFAVLMLGGALMSIIVATVILGFASFLSLLPLVPVFASRFGRRLFVRTPLARTGGRYPFWPLVRTATRIVIVRTGVAYLFFAILLIAFTATLELSSPYYGSGDRLLAIVLMLVMVLVVPLHWLVFSLMTNPVLVRLGQAPASARAKWVWILPVAAVLLAILSGFLVRLLIWINDEAWNATLLPIISWGVGAPMAAVPVYLFLGIITVFFQGIRWDLKSARERIQLRASELRYGPAVKPVLFLRSFSDDEQTVGAERPSLMERFVGGDAHPKRLEEVLADEVFWRAPLVALADPRSGARPLGAARYHVLDTEWKDYVQTRIREFGRIVLCMGSTPNLQWELDEILDSGSLTKTIIVFPAAPEKPRLLSAASARLGPALGLSDPSSEEGALQNVRCIYFDETGGYTAVKADKADAFAFRHALRMALQSPHGDAKSVQTDTPPGPSS